MQNRVFLVTEAFRLMLIGFALIIGFMIISPNQAFAQTDNLVLKREGISSTVIGVNGNTIQLSGGFTADLSEAEFQGRFGEPAQRPEIRVGDFAKISGTVVSSSGQPVMIKAASAHFDIGKEFYYLGLVQDANPQNNTITVLNHEIQLTETSQVLNKKGKKAKLRTFKTFDIIDLDAVGLDTNILINTLQKLDWPDAPPAQIIGFVKSLNGKMMELEGGFKFDLTPFLSSIDGSEFDVYKDLSLYGPGTEIVVGLSEATAKNTPKGDIPVDGAFGFSRLPVSIDGNLQAVDPIARTITVINRTFNVPGDVHVIAPGGGKGDLNSLVVGKGISLYGTRGNEFVVRIVSQPFANLP